MHEILMTMESQKKIITGLMFRCPCLRPGSVPACVPCKHARCDKCGGSGTVHRMAARHGMIKVRPGLKISRGATDGRHVGWGNYCGAATALGHIEGGRTSLVWTRTRGFGDQPGVRVEAKRIGWGAAVCEARRRDAVAMMDGETESVTAAGERRKIRFRGGGDDGELMCLRLV